jgi:hypothetical protein
MYEINVSNKPDYDQHECESSKEGDWVIFRCPICKGYERRIHAVTGEMKVKHANSTARHTGSYIIFERADSAAMLN